MDTIALKKHRVTERAGINIFFRKSWVYCSNKYSQSTYLSTLIIWKRASITIGLKHTRTESERGQEQEWNRGKRTKAQISDGKLWNEYRIAK
jgi:hypothetical protein